MTTIRSGTRYNVVTPYNKYLIVKPYKRITVIMYRREYIKVREWAASKKYKRNTLFKQVENIIIITLLSNINNNNNIKRETDKY